MNLKLCKFYHSMQDFALIFLPFQSCLVLFSQQMLTPCTLIAAVMKQILMVKFMKLTENGKVLQCYITLDRIGLLVALETSWTMILTLIPISWPILLDCLMSQCPIQNCTQKLVFLPLHSHTMASV